MKNILLAVCGLAPQVITEALYALLHAGRQVHAVHIITTRTGKDRLAAGLLGRDKDDRIAALLADFGLDRSELDFDGRNIHTVKNDRGVDIDDITSRDDNEKLLHLCLELTFEFSRDKDTAIWFLVAGGRKTMTSCLTLAAQLYGRPQDRLLHVLVSPDFENCPNFWYPPKKSAVVELRDPHGQPFFKDSRYAKITLINIPFVASRAMLSGDILATPREPVELMRALIRDRPKILTVNLAEGKIIYGGMEMDLHPAQLALYAFFAEQKKRCPKEGTCPGCHDCFLTTEEIISDTGVATMYDKIPGSRLVEEMSDTGISSLSKENFNAYKSKIRRALGRVFGQAQAEELEISATGKRPETRYGIRLDKKMIRMEW